MKSKDKNEKKVTPSESSAKADISIAAKLYRQIHAEHENSVLDLGRFLEQKLGSFPDFIEEIVINNPEISRRLLLMAVRAAKGYVYAPLVFYNCVGSIRLATIPMDQQKKYWHEGIGVATQTASGIVETRVNICDLSSNQTSIVFGNRCVLTFKDQVERLKIFKLRKAQNRVGLLNKAQVMAAAANLLTVEDVLELLDQVRSRAKKSNIAA
jgi:hypothetical protein